MNHIWHGTNFLEKKIVRVVFFLKFSLSFIKWKNFTEKY